MMDTRATRTNPEPDASMVPCTGASATAAAIIERTYTADQIADRTGWIYTALLAESAALDAGNFTVIGTQDLIDLFWHYDRAFFADYFRTNHAGALSFRLSKRMTKNGGKSQFRPDGGVQIVISATLLYQSFNDGDRTITVNGIVCSDRLEALMRIFEHEIIHVLEQFVFGGTSCSKPRFRTLARNFFGHTDVTHRLITQAERAHTKFDIHVGDWVRFEFEGAHEGFVNRITRRATVMVPDPAGNYAGQDGQRYAKYYIPLRLLTPIPDPNHRLVPDPGPGGRQGRNRRRKRSR